MHIDKFDMLITRAMNCSINCQYEEENEGMFYEIESPQNSSNNNESPPHNFYKLCLKMNSIQRRFFVEPVQYITKKSIKLKFKYCPGNYLNLLLLHPPEGMCFEKLNSRDKLYIMKWIFSIACAVKILVENNKYFGNFLLTDRSIFIDPKMNARFFYNFWTDKNSLGKTSVLLPNHFFYSPEIINEERIKNSSTTSVNKPKEELNKNTDNNNNTDQNKEKNAQEDKDCAYSFGILILSILNQRLPNSYFTSLSRSTIDDEICSGKAFRDKIPKCSLEPLINKLINTDRNARIGIMDAIELLIQKEYCLDTTVYPEYRNFIKERFNIIGDVDDTKLLEIIKSNLTEIDLNATDSVQYEKLKLSDLSNFLKLASTTSFYSIYAESCQNVINELLKKLKNQYKWFYHNNVNEKNKFDLIEFCMKHKNDDSLDKLSKLTLFNVDNMVDNSSFYISIHHTDRKVKFIIPKSIEITEDYLKKFNKNCLFTQFYENTENQREIDFYPYLNIYHILYKNSMKKLFDFKQIVIWIYQTAKALAILHDNKYSMLSFNSQNVYIDLNMNAHLFPSKILSTEGQNKLSSTTELLLEKTNYEISYFAPEVLKKKKKYFYSQEKSLVYSFGVFMLELIHRFKPGILLSNFTMPQKLNALMKPIRVPPTNDLKVKNMNEIIQRCLELDCNDRATFSEIVSKIESFITNNSMDINFLKGNLAENINSFFFIDDLEKALNEGSTTVNLILNDLYLNCLDADGKISYQIYMAADPISYSKFDIIWNLLNGRDIDIGQFRSIEMIRPITERKKKEASEKVENESDKNYGYGDFIQDEVGKLKRGFVRIKNKQISRYCHVCALNPTSMRQAVLRCGMNPDYNFRQRTEFVVRNKFHDPYGKPMQMDDVNKVIIEYLQEGFFKNKASTYFNNPNGNSILDLEVV